MDTDLSASDASFWGEDESDLSGASVAGAGDVNGDGYDDILIGAVYDEEGGTDAGQTYLIFPDHNSRPMSISSVKAYSDDEYSQEITNAYVGNKIFLELTASDGDGRKNIAEVWVKGSSNPNKRFRLRLLETGENTGTFRGNITIANRTHDRYRWINVSGSGWVEISSMKDPTILINLSVRPGIYLETRPTIVYLSEDDNYSIHFNTTGEKPESWTLDTNAPWLFWDEFTNNLVGFPYNLHVGTYWVNVHVQGIIYWDEINFTIVVNNTPPEISSPDKLFIYEDEELFLDLNSTDEGEGNVTWNLDTNANWLNQNSSSGVLYGNPTNLDVGSHNINVSFDDGNGGEDFQNFILEVLNTIPAITTQNIVEIYQDEEYFNDYNSTDDGQGSIAWSLTTNAKWLSINSNTGVLNGTPKNDDVGIYSVNISVSDGNGGIGWHNFTLTVENVNDPPVLYDGNFTPGNGSTSTNFTFSIMYKDIDSDEPVNISIILDGHWYSMIRNGSIPFDFKRGVRYNFTSNLTEGVHQYYYSVSDGKIIVKFPRKENLTTPYIQLAPKSDTEKDSDGDGYNDTYEGKTGSDPNDKKSTPLDRDGDGVLNVNDAFPDDPNRWENEENVEQSESAINVWIVVLILVSIIAVAGAILYLSKKRKAKEVEQSSEDDLGRAGKGEIEEA